MQSGTIPHTPDLEQHTAESIAAMPRQQQVELAKQTIRTSPQEAGKFALAPDSFLTAAKQVAPEFNAQTEQALEKTVTPSFVLQTKVHGKRPDGETISFTANNVIAELTKVAGEGTHNLATAVQHFAQDFRGGTTILERSRLKKLVWTVTTALGR